MVGVVLADALVRASVHSLALPEAHQRVMTLWLWPEVSEQEGGKSVSTTTGRAPESEGPLAVA